MYKSKEDMYDAKIVKYLHSLHYEFPVLRGVAKLSKPFYKAGGSPKPRYYLLR